MCLDSTVIQTYAPLVLTFALVGVTAYYAYTVRGQTTLMQFLTKTIFDNSKRDRLMKEMDFLVAPIIRLEQCINVLVTYWNWHNALILDDIEAREVISEHKELFDILSNVVCYKYLSSGHLHQAMSNYLTKLENIERIRGEYNKSWEELDTFIETDEMNLAIRELKTRQLELFSEAKIRYEYISKELQKLET